MPRDVHYPGLVYFLIKIHPLNGWALSDISICSVLFVTQPAHKNITGCKSNSNRPWVPVMIYNHTPVFNQPAVIQVFCHWNKSVEYTEKASLPAPCGQNSRSYYYSAVIQQCIQCVSKWKCAQDTDGNHTPGRPGVFPFC